MAGKSTVSRIAAVYILPQIVILAQNILLWRVKLPFNSGSFFGPYRWWNEEVFSSHALKAALDQLTLDGARALFWPSHSTPVTEGYYLNADSALESWSQAQLRLIEDGVAYTSFPPLGFLALGFVVLLFSLVGLEFEFIPLIFYMGAALAISHLASSLRDNYFPRLKNLTLGGLVVASSVTTPIFIHGALHYVWVYELLLALWALGLAIALRSGNSSLLSTTIVAALPLISFTGVILSLSLIFLSRLRNGNWVQSRIQIAGLLASLIFLATIFAVTFRNPLDAIASVIFSFQSRIEVPEGLVAQPLSFVHSLGFSVFLVMTALLYVVRHSSEGGKLVGIWIVLMAGIIESMVLSGHSATYPFTHLLIIPAVTLSQMAFLSAASNQIKSSKLASLTVAITLLVIIFSNYLVHSIVYNPDLGYFG